MMIVMAMVETGLKDNIYFIYTYYIMVNISILTIIYTYYIMVNIDILTYGTGYKFYVYERFFGSLFDTGFKGNVFIVINETDLKTINPLLEKYKSIKYVIDDIVKTTNINNHRFFVYKTFFNKINSDYVFLCDFRDVLFQKNIETYTLDDNVDIFGFLEDGKIKISKVNKYWLDLLDEKLNTNIYKKISNKNICCCGTTIGKKNAIYNYIQTMCNIICDNSIKTNLDQAIHNYILYLNILKVNIKFLTNKDNLINTTSAYKPKRFSLETSKKK